jgi:hypothetical protein
MLENPMLGAMIDNWVRLGLVEVDYDKHFADENNYIWAEKRPEYLRLSESPPQDGMKIGYEKGIMVQTELGKRFARAIGLF